MITEKDFECWLSDGNDSTLSENFEENENFFWKEVKYKK